MCWKPISRRAFKLLRPAQPRVRLAIVPDEKSKSRAGIAAVQLSVRPLISNANLPPNLSALEFLRFFLSRQQDLFPPDSAPGQVRGAISVQKQKRVAALFFLCKDNPETCAIIHKPPAVV